MENGTVPTKLTKGSRYRIVSKGDSNANTVSIGEFLGYVQFGQDSGLLVKVDEKNEAVMRIIPSMGVLYIDILEMKAEDEVKKKDVRSVSYG